MFIYILFMSVMFMFTFRPLSTGIFPQPIASSSSAPAQQRPRGDRVGDRRTAHLGEEPEFRTDLERTKSLGSV